MMQANSIRLSLLDGPRVQIDGPNPADYEVSFIDGDSGVLVYRTVIRKGSWAQANPKYFVNWHVVVKENGRAVFDHKVDLRGKKVFVGFASKALGDNIAWMPYVEEFRRRHQAEVHVRTFWNPLFRKSYSELHFVDDGIAEGCYAAFALGAFDGDYSRNRNHWRLIPLQQIASDMLGLGFSELRARVDRSDEPRPIPGRYVAISEYSTFHAKHWLHPGGWQEIVDWLIGQGYAVVSPPASARRETAGPSS